MQELLEYLDVLGIAGFSVLLIFKYFIPELKDEKKKNAENQIVIRGILEKNITAINVFMNDQRNTERQVKESSTDIIGVMGKIEEAGKDRHKELTDLLKEMNKDFKASLEKINKA